ncbi:3-oxoadipate enol-lactonase/4-carboxymuconolactone decarboxylase [Caulobacter rhizosphaerae]|uniref:3-oxoadipate enol-lactonase/4-carboxymuconolactone decarboxylase n=1 Tax=Caulobacter rhizosphaerae TaxID=2010972 RepID=A0ABU1MTQ2_9CAUL|nr:3-oxoadipate enol-lactonase [Caulobacter rhizosphaerae]MDR6529536.1 3-oxoadipate enol-lactonase/4-carboxymuconolactone decarboxylase [Caulobacter rhizosphaerae]
MPFALSQGARIYWRADGAADKPVLVLLNSIGCDLSLYDLVVPMLTPDFRVLRIDTRGHGASDAPAGDYSLDLLADDVLAVMDAAGAAKASICGTSLGAMIAMALAPKAPERVEALVLACTSPAMDPSTWDQRLALIRAEGLSAIVDAVMGRFFSDAFRVQHPEVVETVRTGMLAQNPDGYCGCGAAIRDMALLEALPAISAPTLVLTGAKDLATPFEGHAERIVSAIPGARHAVVEGAHLPSLEAPAALAGAVRGFLAEVLHGTAVRDAKDILFEAGLVTRRKVLGDAWVDKSLAKRTAFTADYQAMITRYAWNEIWGRPGLDHRTRRLLVLAICASLARWEEFRLHVRAGLEQGGFTEDELKEVLMQIAIYAGVPAANTAFTEAAEVIAKLG